MLDIAGLDLNIVTHSIVTTARRSRVERNGREHNAATLGLTPIGRCSVYAMVVGVHPQIPNIVFKVCHSEDGFIQYATDCMQGTLVGPHFLKVYSVTQIDEDTTLCVVERLVNDADAEMYRRVGDAYYNPVLCNENDHSLVKAIQDMRLKYEYLDLHSGNYMSREDGTIVFCDPVASFGDLRAVS